MVAEFAFVWCTAPIFSNRIQTEITEVHGAMCFSAAQIGSGSVGLATRSQRNAFQTKGNKDCDHSNCKAGTYPSWKPSQPSCGSSATSRLSYFLCCRCLG